MKVTRCTLQHEVMSLGRCVVESRSTAGYAVMEEKRVAVLRNLQSSSRRECWHVDCTFDEESFNPLDMKADEKQYMHLNL